jgi:hypothetical protein
MVIISSSMAVPNGLTFTVGQITWITGPDVSISMTAEEAWIQPAPMTTHLHRLRLRPRQTRLRP